MGAGSGPRPALGAYGLRLDGLDDNAGELQVPVPASWPSLQITVRVGPIVARANRFGDHDAHVTSEHSASRLRRTPLTAELTVPEPHGGGEILQPFLGATAAVASRWLGRQAFHAGAFVADRGHAVAVLGAKGAGKSTTLALLHLAGAPVLTDDLLVIDGARAFAGPRCVDLRGDAAEQLQAGVALGRVGARERWRVRLPPVEPDMALGGWIVPEWGDELEVWAVPVAERLQLLIDHLAIVIEPHGPEHLLRLAALPFWRLRRPRRWEATDALVAALRALPTRPMR